LQSKQDIPPKFRIDFAAYQEKSVTFVIYLENNLSVEHLHILTKLANQVHVSIGEDQLGNLNDEFKKKLGTLGIGLIVVNNDSSLDIIFPPQYEVLPLQTIEKVIRSIDFKLHLDNFYNSAIVIDGSNALLWNVPEGEKGKIADLELVIASLKELGFSKIYTVIGPSIIFRVDDKTKLNQLLKNSRWIKAPPSIDSDIILLDKALEESGYIVSNDKFEDHSKYAKFLHKRLILFHFDDNKVRFYWAHNQKQIKGKIDEN
jgi:hypothetical protein